MLQEISYDELKTELSKCTAKMLMFIIMLSDEELMYRLDKNELLETK